MINQFIKKEHKVLVVFLHAHIEKKHNNSVSVLCVHS